MGSVQKDSSHSKTELVQLALHILNDFCFENLALFENLFHSHTRHYDSRLSFYDTFDNILDVITASRRSLVFLSIRNFPREDLRIFAESFNVIIGTDGENRRQGEL